MNVTEWKPGDVVDSRYEVRRVLGQGGMGAVYEVFHRWWRIPLAVKTALPSAVGSDEGLARYLREAEAWVNLGVHPNVATAHYVKAIDGFPRIFLELVPGGSLHDWIAEKRIRSIEAALELLLHVCNGLAFAHARGLVHRDIKPRNVLLTPEGVAKVTDFGLVRRVRELEKILPEKTAVMGSVLNWADYTVRTMGGYGFGTPHYMAPEQWKDASLATVESDVYSFGVMMVETLTGRRPFEPASSGTAAMLELQHLHGTAEPAGLESVAAPVAAVARRCLAKPPAERFRSFEEVHDELGDVFRKMTRRDPPRVRAAGLGGRPSELNNRALSQLDLGQAEEARRSLLEALRVDPAHLKANLNLLLLDWREGRIHDTDVIARAQELVQQYRDEPLPTFFIGLVHLARGDLARALDWLGRVVRQVPDNPDSRGAYGLALLRADRQADAFEELGRARGLAPNDPAVLINTAVAALRLGRWADAKTLAEQAAALGAGGPDLRVLRGIIEAGLAEPETATADFNAVLQQDPDHPAANVSMGEMLAGIRDVVPAFAQEEPQRTRARKYLERAFRATAGAPRALDSLRRLGEKAPSAGDLERLLADRDASRAAMRRGADLVSVRFGAPSGPPSDVATRGAWLDERRILIALDSGDLAIVDGAEVSRVARLPRPARDVALDEARRRLAVVTEPQGASLLSWPEATRVAILDEAALAVAAVPSRGWFASGGRGYAVRLWRAESGEPAGALDTDAEETRGLAVAPVAGLLACRHTTTASVWRLDDRSCVFRAARHSQRLATVDISLDGRLLLTAGFDGRVILWRLGNRQPELELECPDVSAAALSPDLRFIVTSESGRLLRLWDAARGRCLRTEEVADRADGVAFSPSGRRFAFWRRGVAVAEITTRLDQPAPDHFQIGYFLSRPRPAEALAREHAEVANLLETGRQSLADRAWERAYHCFRAAKATPGYERDADVLDGLAQCGRHGERFAVRQAWQRAHAAAEVSWPCLAPDASAVFGVVRHGIARWDLRGDRIDAEPWRRGGVPERLSISPNGALLAAAKTGRLEILSVATAEPLWQLSKEELGGAVAAVFTGDSRRIVAGGWDGRLRVYDLERREPPLVLPVEESLTSASREAVTGVYVATAALRAASGHGDRRVRLWDIDRGTFLGETPPLTDVPRSLRVSGDGQRVYALSADGRQLDSWIWSGAVLEPLPPIPFVSQRFGNAGVLAFDMTPDERFILTAGPGQFVALWELRQEAGTFEARPVRRFEAHTGLVTWATFTPDARFAISIQRGGFHVWEFDWDYDFDGARP